MKELVDGMIFPVNLTKLNLLSNPITLTFFRNTIILFLESQSTLLDVRRDLGLVERGAIKLARNLRLSAKTRKVWVRYATWTKPASYSFAPLLLRLFISLRFTNWKPGKGYTSHERKVIKFLEVLYRRIVMPLRTLIPWLLPCYTQMKKNLPAPGGLEFSNMDNSLSFLNTQCAALTIACILRDGKMDNAMLFMEATAA